MSLRAKLYLAFAVMIVLAVIIGGAALVAFTSTQARIESTKGQIQYVDSELIPASLALSNLSTYINGAGLNYYAYSYNAFDSDFAKAGDTMTQARKEIATMEAILAKASLEHLPSSRKHLPDVKKNVEVLTAKANDLKAAIESVDHVREDVRTQIKNMDTILNSLLTDTVADLRKGFLEEKIEKGELPAVMVRRFERIAFVDGLQDGLTVGQMLFWEAQANFGETADKLFKESVAKMNEVGEKALAYANSPNVGKRQETKQAFLDLAGAIEKYSRGIGVFAKAWRDSDHITGEITSLSDSSLKTTNEMTAMTGQQVLNQTRAIREATEYIDETVDGSAFISMIILGLAVLAGILCAVFITRSITRPIILVIDRLVHAEKTLSGASNEISGAARELADGVSEQASAIEETSSALEQMASMTRQNADNAQKTNGMTQDTGKLVSGGSSAMREMSEAMTEINDKSDKVSLIIKTISDISFQTNLLALNAAVEAARAGEAGKGFAVVADEVRNLSQRSAQAAKDTATLITSTVSSVKNGGAIADRLTSSFKTIEDGARDITRLIQEIANATNEQAQGVDQVNTAMAQMDKVTQQNSASASATASASGQLEAQIVEMHDDVGLLQDIVYGAGRRREPTTTTKRDDNASAARGRRDRLLPAPEGRGEMVLRPDRVIPLDD